MLRNQHVVRHVEHHPARLEALYDAVQLPLLLQHQEVGLGRLLAVYHKKKKKQMIRDSTQNHIILFHKNAEADDMNNFVLVEK